MSNLYKILASQIAQLRLAEKLQPEEVKKAAKHVQTFNTVDIGLIFDVMHRSQSDEIAAGVLVQVCTMEYMPVGELQN